MSRVDPDARILLVDDSANDVEIALVAFAERGLGGVIDVARSGHEALDRLTGRVTGADGEPVPPPALVLLDLKMPGVSGFDVLREIKATPGLGRLPVVVLTSSREEGDRALAYDAGANSYLVKPVSFEEMLGIVDAIAAFWLTVHVGPPLSGRSGSSPSRDG